MQIQSPYSAREYLFCMQVWWGLKITWLFFIEILIRKYDSTTPAYTNVSALRGFLIIYLVYRYHSNLCEVFQCQYRMSVGLNYNKDRNNGKLAKRSFINLLIPVLYGKYDFKYRYGSSNVKILMSTKIQRPKFVLEWVNVCYSLSSKHNWMSTGEAFAFCHSVPNICLYFYFGQ